MNLKDFLSQPTSCKYELLKITSYILNIPIEKLYSLDLEIDSNKVKKIQELFEKYTKEKVPLEYLLGEVDFFWNKFFVNENVLIPRPETEYLVKYAIEEIKFQLSSLSSNLSIYDIWTGSWVIWITICKKLNIPVICSDISEKALEIAQKNAKNLWCKKITFLKSSLAEHIKNDNFKIICANLPYVPENFEVDDYTKKEPSLALFAENEGFALYEKLLEQISNAILFFELTKKQAEKLVEKFSFNQYEVLDTCHENIKILKIKV